MIYCAAHLYRAPSLSSCGQISLRCPSPLCQHTEISQAACHLPVAYKFSAHDSLRSADESHYMLCKPAVKLVFVAPDSFCVEVTGDNLSRAIV